MMNAHKAREYFSAHYEGSLDRGLRESFERVLRSDAQIQAEYKAFCGTMDQLSQFGLADVEPPSDLHDRIMARLDLNAWEQKQQRRVPTFAWWKTGLVAAAVIAVAAFGAIRAGQEAPGTPTEATVVPQMSPRARLDVKPTENGVELSYPRVGNRVVSIRNAEGQEQERIELVNQAIENKLLTNEGATAAIVEIVIEDSHTWIALPGQGESPDAVGQGDIRQLALDIANQCQIPVVYQGADLNLNPWEIDSSDAHRSAEGALKNHNLKIELRGDRSEPRILWILEN